MAGSEMFQAISGTVDENIGGGSHVVMFVGFDRVASEAFEVVIWIVVLPATMDTMASDQASCDTCKQRFGKLIEARRDGLFPEFRNAMVIVGNESQSIISWPSAHSRCGQRIENLHGVIDQVLLRAAFCQFLQGVRIERRMCGGNEEGRPLGKNSLRQWRIGSGANDSA